MGKGDIKTKKGKRTAGSYGVSRKKKKVKPVIEIKPKAKKKKATKATSKTTEKKAAPKKAATKKTAAKAKE